MSGISGITSAMRIAAGSLLTHSTGMQVASHNIANVNTGGFAPQRLTYADGPKGLGAELESVRKAEVPDATCYPESVRSFFGGKAPSGTELAKEIPQMTLTQRAFQANAAIIRTADEMFGTLLDTIA